MFDAWFSTPQAVEATRILKLKQKKEVLPSVERKSRQVKNSRNITYYIVNHDHDLASMLTPCDNNINPLNSQYTSQFFAWPNLKSVCMHSSTSTR
jgi:hypothetical protein